MIPIGAAICFGIIGLIVGLASGVFICIYSEAMIESRKKAKATRDALRSAKACLDRMKVNK